MIQISRLPAPAYLNLVKVAKWHQTLCSDRATYYRELSQSLKNKAPAPIRPRPDRSHYAHSDVRVTLEKMFDYKCAYCEGDVKAVSPQHVEHYRPASRYPGLVYQWENLLLACPHCNSTYKKDRFPVAPAGNTPNEHRRNPCSRTGVGEVPLLLNPCTDDPALHLTFRNGRVIALDAKGRFTRRVCGLNRDDLVRSRREHRMYIRRSAEHYKTAEAVGDASSRHKYADELLLFTYYGSPYAAMARAELHLLGIDWRIL